MWHLMIIFHYQDKHSAKLQNVWI